jgi:hypothetical protein
MKDAVDWLEKYRRFWEQSYALLDSLLASLQTPVNKPEPASKKGKKDA